MVRAYQVEAVCLCSDQTLRVELVDEVGVRGFGSFVGRKANAHDAVLEVSGGG